MGLPQPQAEPTDKHMDEFFKEVSLIKVIHLLCLLVHSKAVNRKLNAVSTFARNARRQRSEK